MTRPFLTEEMLALLVVPQAEIDEAVANGERFVCGKLVVYVWNDAIYVAEELTC